MTSVARTESGKAPAGTVTSAWKSGNGWACWLLYNRVGARGVLNVRTPGSACTRRRSPHSEAALAPAAIVRHRSRATTGPDGATVTFTQPESLFVDSP